MDTRKILCYLSKINKMVLELEVTIMEELKMIYANNKIQIGYLVIIKFITYYKK